MNSPVDTLKASLAVLRQNGAPDADRANAISKADTALAALSGREAVGWAQVDQYGNFIGMRWNSPLNIQDGQPFYTTPRIPDGCKDVIPKHDWELGPARPAIWDSTLVTGWKRCKVCGMQAYYTADATPPAAPREE